MNLEHTREATKHGDARIFLPAFNSAQVAGVNLRAVRHFLLGEALRLPQLPNVRPHYLLPAHPGMSGARRPRVEEL